MPPSRAPRPAPACGALGAARGWVLGLALALVAAPGSAAGQALADPLVPRGRVRFDFVPSLSSWDTRYGVRREGGAAVEGEEELGVDLTDPRGLSLFPGIATLEERLRTLSGDAGFQGTVGSVSGWLDKEVTRLDMGLRVGVFDWLTVGANVPYVKGQSTLDFAFRADPAANLGVSPALTANSAVGRVLSGLGTAAVAASGRAQTVCGAGAGADCQSATALARRANDFWQGMFGAYFASPFFPLGSAPVSTRLQAAFASLDGALAAAGLPRVGAPLAFATKGVDEQTLRGLPSDPASGIGMTPIQSYPGLWQLGDIEVNATVRLLEGERRDSGAVSPRLAWAIHGGFLVRLPTGALDDPAVFLDVASGDAQQDMEGRLEAGLRIGSRLGFRGGFRYGTQGGVDVVRRVAPHEALLPLENSARVVRWTPGSYTLIELSPRVHLGEALALAADYRRFHKAQDGYELVGEEPEGAAAADPSLLAGETEMTFEEVAVGLRYSSLGLWRQGRVGTPAELGLRWILPLSGSGGQTPKATRVEFSLSLFRRIWG
ncbi:MAG: hypothetical protein Q8N53_05760 [Longimicrobiales bacterium]|nr:hypothetical protein [Longimicrobiales bacterium]